MCDTVLNTLQSLIGQIDDGCCCGPCGPCGPDPVLNQLKSLICQIGGGCGPCPPGCCPPACCPPSAPFAYPQVCMTTPPPCLAPTAPKYVKPLAMPSVPCRKTPKRDAGEDYRTRIANFYNSYNIDYRSTGPKCGGSSRKSGCGQTVDGKNRKCEDYMKPKPECEPQGCPTGFKPCAMKLCPPPGCSPLGVWKAEIQPCPPKPRKSVSVKYVPEPCCRPCCKHWKPKGGPCLYPLPCKAACIDHPPGIKP